MLPGSLALPDWSEFESSLLRSTEMLATELSRDGVEVEAQIARGPAGQVLIEASRQADLLVVGARGLGRVKGLVLGSVSQRCASHGVVPTAVIAIEAPLGPARRIVVGYDGSTNARAAAQWALGFAEPDAAITILDALPLVPSIAPDLVRERFPAEVRAAEAEFDAQMGELDPDRARRPHVRHRRCSRRPPRREPKRRPGRPRRTWSGPTRRDAARVDNDVDAQRRHSGDDCGPAAGPDHGLNRQPPAVLQQRVHGPSGTAVGPSGFRDSLRALHRDGPAQRPRSPSDIGVAQLAGNRWQHDRAGGDAFGRIIGVSRQERLGDC